jgi:glycosylphosphatidylinositol transamidase (GPIT) subunit GPI8
MKNSYTLLITIILISLFSFLAISILQTKSLRAENLTNQYLYIQGKNHKNFLKDYLRSIDLEGITSFEIEDEIFKIYAKIEKNNSIFTIDIFVKAKEFNISLYERVIKE